jgi:hypothetical protein
MVIQMRRRTSDLRKTTITEITAAELDIQLFKLRAGYEASDQQKNADFTLKQAGT